MLYTVAALYACICHGSQYSHVVNIYHLHQLLTTDSWLAAMCHACAVQDQKNRINDGIVFLF